MLPSPHTGACACGFAVRFDGYTVQLDDGLDWSQQTHEKHESVAASHGQRYLLSTPHLGQTPINPRGPAVAHDVTARDEAVTPLSRQSGKGEFD